MGSRFCKCNTKIYKVAGGFKMDFFSRNWYKIHSFRFAISTDVPDIADELSRIFPPLERDPGEISADFAILRRNGSTPALYENGSVIRESTDTEHLVELLEWTATFRVLESLSSFFQLHASGIAIGEKALLFAGPPGSGKTVLALSLLLQGFRCLSDEIILIEPRTLKAHPFPRNFHVELELLKTLPDLRKYVLSKPLTDSSGKVRINAETIHKGWQKAPVDPHWIIFSAFSPEDRDELIPVGKTRAVSLLVDQAINLEGFGASGVDTLVRLVESCDCYIFKAGNIDSVSVLMEELTP